MQINENIKEAISKATSILITTHIYPDADGIGSQISLCLALRELGKQSICFNEKELLERYKYLDHKNVVHSIDTIGEHNFKPDLIIVVDTNTRERTGSRMLDYYKTTDARCIYFDHHPCIKKISENHFIDTTAAATGQMAGELIQSLGVSFTKEMVLLII